jgi:predicted metal-dependent peptidase
MSDVVYDDKLPTLAVELVNHKGEVLDKPMMLINKDFWDKHNHREHLFMTLHECLHVILDHGERNGKDVPGSTPETVNMAQDITINEMIVDLFGYDREDFRDWKKYCWIDTCFANPRVVKRRETFTYYLKLLIKEQQAGGSGKPDTSILDVHSGPGTGSGEPQPGDGEGKQPGAGGDEKSDAEAKARIDVAKVLVEELTPDEINAIIRSLPENASKMAGTMAGALESILGTKTSVKRIKLKFANIVRKLKRSRMKIKTVDTETFSRDNRRFDDVIRTSNAALPGKGEREKLTKDKLFVALFMDVSGSCMPYKKTFEEVFIAFDQEREIFETRLFIFDTSVTPVKPGDRIYEGGGTYFHIIEPAALELEKEFKRYPDCIVVITDGYGDNVKPKLPANWVWLLTDGSSTANIPKGSRWFKIKDVTF